MMNADQEPTTPGQQVKPNEKAKNTPVKDSTNE